MLVVGIALGVAGMAASEERCAKAGGRKALGRQRARRRLSPRKERELRMARSAGIGRISRPGRTAAAGGLQLPPPERESIQCPPLPWLPERADEAIFRVLKHGEEDECRITAAALQLAYPVTEYGDEIVWPSRPDDCAGIRLLEERMRRRVVLRVAELRDKEADEVYG